jgi:hypothetical protein
MKTRSAVLELFHGYGQTDGWNDLIGAPQRCEAPKMDQRDTDFENLNWIQLAQVIV